MQHYKTYPVLLTPWQFDMYEYDTQVFVAYHPPFRPISIGRPTPVQQ